MGAKGFTAVMGVLALIALLAFGVIDKSEGALEVGAAAPVAELPMLEVGEMDGASGSLSDYRGQWVLVNVWASWCNPCRDESPALEAFYREHRDDGFTVLGIDSQDTTGDALEFVEEFDLSYPQLHDGSGDYAEELKTTGVPESFLIDPEGNLALPRPGPVTEEYLAESVLPLIESGA